jgi:hypothetical protein
MAQESPYTPGVVARSVPGRAEQLRFYTRRAEEVGTLKRFVGRVRVDYAARGVGKTSLLREGQRIFEREGVRTVWVTASEDERLLPVVLTELAHLLPAGKRLPAELARLVDSVTFSLNTGAAKAAVTFKPGTATTPSAAKAFIQILTAVASQVGGVAILVDEVQLADRPSLRSLAEAWQELASAPKPPAAALFLVGLPGAVDHIIRAATFAERFQFEPLREIDAAGATEALLAPAQALGVTWDVDALRAASASANGYAYKVQLVGEATWEAAGNLDAGERITLAAVTEAAPAVAAQMDILFAARWRQASKRQRDLMMAVAELGGVDVKREDIAERLGMSTTSLSTARDGLLRKGIIDANRYGRLSFLVPGFTEYVLRRA